MGWDVPGAEKRLELKGQSIVVYDLEIKEPIDGEKVTWSSYGSMGISVGVSFNYATGDFSTYFDDNMPDLIAELKSAKLIVGFNHIGFDNRLLRAQPFSNELPSDEMLSQYDILVESRKAMGWTPGDRFPSGMKLDQHLESMFGKSAMKTGNGELAPQLYQAKRWGPLVSYCIADVKRTCMVFETIWNEGWVSTAAHGKRFIAPPQALLEI